VSWLASLAGCGSSASNENARPRFAFVVNVPTDRFWDIAYSGCLQAASEENVVVEFHAPNEATAHQQKQILESLLSRGIDGIAVSPLNPDSLSMLLDKATDLCPVICQDSDAPNSKRFCYIGTDNVALGRKQGELMKQALPNGGKIALFVGQLDVANAQERQQGVLEALAGEKYEIVGTFTDGGQPAEAKRVVTDVISKHPDINGIVGLWGYNAPQAVNALSSLPDHQVVIVGSDESEETFRCIESGQELGTIAQQPFEFGYQSIKMLARLHRGEEPQLPSDKKIYVDSFLLTAENLEDMEKDISAKLSLIEKYKEFRQ
jgi:ribose transport system substrate-binding protein